MADVYQVIREEADQLVHEHGPGAALETVDRERSRQALIGPAIDGFAPRQLNVFFSLEKFIPSTNAGTTSLS